METRGFTIPYAASANADVTRRFGEFSKAGLATQAPAFPKAEDFFFGPLAETVKVYSKSFVVAVPVRAESSLRSHVATAGIADLPVGGTVSYQACDEKVCFPPQSASFEGRLQVRVKGH